MNQRRSPVLQASLLLAATLLHAAVQDTLRIKVLDSETRSFNIVDNNGVPKNCDQLNYDAYCHSSKTVETVNTLLVQVGSEAPFRVSCSVDTKWSRCVPLLRGESFNAKKEKRGITVYYVDDRGKLRKQLYTYVAEDAKDSRTEAVAQGDTQVSPSPRENVGLASTAIASATSPEESVKCRFSSTPSGAEIKVDGRYVGSTPSLLSLGTGVHVVAISLPGFVLWTRELTVSRESDLTVYAVLQKVQ